MKRFPDWEVRLDAYLTATRRTPFAWDGSHDCCTFCAGGVEAQTGEDPMTGLRGLYANKAEALRLLRGEGGLEIWAPELARKLGLPEVPVLQAPRGGIVLGQVETDAGIGPALGLLGLDGRHAVFAAPRGQIRLPIGTCVRAWRLE